MNTILASRDMRGVKRSYTNFSSYLFNGYGLATRLITTLIKQIYETIWENKQLLTRENDVDDDEHVIERECPVCKQSHHAANV